MSGRNSRGHGFSRAVTFPLIVIPSHLERRPRGEDVRGICIFRPLQQPHAKEVRTRN